MERLSNLFHSPRGRSEFLWKKPWEDRRINYGRSTHDVNNLEVQYVKKKVHLFQPKALWMGYYVSTNTCISCLKSLSMLQSGRNRGRKREETEEVGRVLGEGIENLPGLQILQRSGVQLFESLASLWIIGAWWRAVLKPLKHYSNLVSRCFRGALKLDPILLKAVSL